MYSSSCVLCSLIMLWSVGNWYACITSEPTKKNKLENSRLPFQSLSSNSIKISIQKMPKSLSKNCTAYVLPKPKRKAITNWLWLHFASWQPAVSLPTMWLKKSPACMLIGQLLTKPMVITPKLSRSLISYWKLILVIRPLNLKSVA